MFAKLFDTEIGQILVKKDAGDDGLEIRFFFHPDGFGICSVAINGFKDDEEGWLALDNAFDRIDSSEAMKIIKPTLYRLKANTTDYESDVSQKHENIDT